MGVVVLPFPNADRLARVVRVAGRISKDEAGQLSRTLTEAITS